MTYPSNLIVTYQPNALGQPTQVIGTAGGVGSPLATDATYYPNGALHQFTYGNNIVHSMQQNDRQLPASVTSGAITNFNYPYDATSNISQITDLVGQSGRQTRSMTYDALDRLKTADSPMFGGAMTYGYDALDNLRSVSAPDRNLRYCYNTSQQLTFVRSNSTGCSDGAAQTTLDYDLQGNVASKNQVGYRFDRGNRLREAAGTGINERYQYDAYGRRVLAERTVGAADTLGVIYSQYASNGQLMYQENGRSAVNKRIDQVYLGGSLIAQREVPMWGGTATIKYQHTDALGSPVAVTDAAGGLLERMEYEPFGKGIAGGPDVGAPKDGAGYTGHVLDVATGMNYMQQRYYDPSIGRFLSVDPVSADPNTGAMFNRYNYAFNNPYRFTDPDGRVPRGSSNLCALWCDSWTVAGGGGGGGRDDSTQNDEGNPPRAAGPGSVFKSRNQAQGEAEAYVTDLNGGPIRSLLGGQMYLINIIQLGSANAFTYALTPVQTGIAPAVGIGSARSVIFGTATHSFLRLEKAGLNSARVANVVGREAVRIRDVMAVGVDVGGRMLINGVLIEYRMFKLPNGTINVGTIFPVL